MIRILKVGNAYLLGEVDKEKTWWKFIPPLVNDSRHEVEKQIKKICSAIDKPTVEINHNKEVLEK